MSEENAKMSVLLTNTALNTPQRTSTVVSQIDSETASGNVTPMPVNQVTINERFTSRAEKAKKAYRELYTTHKLNLSGPDKKIDMIKGTSYNLQERSAQKTSSNDDKEKQKGMTHIAK
jgi:hypothetical protein